MILFVMSYRSTLIQLVKKSAVLTGDNFPDSLKQVHLNDSSNGLHSL